MKELNTKFDKWFNHFSTEENKHVFNCLKDRMSFNSPNSNYTTIRWEIHNCLCFGMNQAAITLTNHYLERFLKFSIIKHHLKKPIENISEYSKATKTLVDNHGSQNLEQSINYAKRIGLISKKESDILSDLKNVFRNPFSHNDIKKLFGEEETNLWKFSFNEPGVVKEHAKIKIASFIPLQSAKLDNIAKKSAYAYFIFIDDLACRTLIKFNPDYKTYQLHKDIDYEKIFDTYMDNGKSLK